MFSPAEPNFATGIETGVSNASPGVQPLVEALTAREVEIVKLLAEGLSTRDIARRLGICFKTGVCHRYRILGKLGVTNTVLAVRWAIRSGVVEP